MEGNSLTSFENLCKIFEMRIKLDKDNGVKSSLDVLNSYEKYCKKIDVIYNNEFQKELKPLISPAITLEKEKDRLRRLIRLLEDRLDRRIELEDRFYETTGKYIDGLQMIISEGELEEKRQRLSLIAKYLDNMDEIQSVSDSIVELKNSLEEEEDKKVQYEEKNKILEDELYSSFMSIINSDEYYIAIKEDDINTELDKIKVSVLESKETLDITKESIGALVNNGLDDDYVSYIEEAEKNYYSLKNKEIILKIYKLVIDFEDDFKLICAKRDKINEILNEKKELVESLMINVDNELLSFEKVILLQCEVLNNEREILDNITNYNSRIKFKEERLVELNEANNSVEILAILREYGLIETYDTEDVVLDVEEDIVSEIPSLDLQSIFEEAPIVEEVYNPYRIVEVTDYPKTLNVGLARLKGESVREKVNKKLNPMSEEVIHVDGNLDNNMLVNDINVVGTVDSQSDDLTDKTEDTTKLLFDDLDTLNNVNKDNVNTEINLPVWELPTEASVKPVDFDLSSPVLPIWESVKPEFDVSKENTQDDKSNDTNEMEKPIDAFWIPVSESKMDTKNLSNFNIPFNNNFNKNDDFVFPTINN